MASIVVGKPLSIDDVIQVARHGAPVALAEAARGRVVAARALIDGVQAAGRPVYGVTTGFGKFSDVSISAAELADLQRNLIVSHACGVGEPLAPEVARAMVLLRVQALAQGYSGIRLETLELLIELLNRGVTPVIPSQGSLGASGDLAPLAHLALVLLGEGEAWVGGQRLPGAEALAAVGLAPVTLAAKEGLALINGTQLMAGLGALLVGDGAVLLKAADIIAALTAEALRGIPAAWSEGVQRVRLHAGQAAAAENLRRLVEGSQLVTAPGELRVQDAYTLRCLPQIHGASRTALEHVTAVLAAEINAVTDNPLVFVDEGEIISGGNFHGQVLALPLDYLAIALAELANVSERRLERLVNPALNDGLPAFLTANGGLHSGLMIAQYTAAALVSENKVLAHPASVDSIPSSANQEDHVSMGAYAARKAATVLANVQQVLAIEWVAAAQALEFVGPERLGVAGQAAYGLLRSQVAPLAGDRVMQADFAAARALLASGQLVKTVEEALGDSLL